MAFAPGDRVHIRLLGTGIVRDVRNGDRYGVEIKGRTMVIEGARMERAEPARSRARDRQSTAAPLQEPEGSSTHAVRSLDLHGKTVEEAILALDTFLDEALLASIGEVHVIHGRSGGRIRDAVHARLRELPPIRAFRLDPRNPGVTIVSL